MEPAAEELIKSQIAKSHEKLKAAKSLFKEAFYDDAISRAYYSMFHAASAVLFSEGITVETHSALKTMFGLRFVVTGKVDKKFGRWLNEIKDERENGDYDILTSFEDNDAKEAVIEAEEFLKEMKSFLTKTYNISF